MSPGLSSPRTNLWIPNPPMNIPHNPAANFFPFACWSVELVLSLVRLLLVLGSWLSNATFGTDYAFFLIDFPHSGQNT